VEGFFLQKLELNREVKRLKHAVEQFFRENIDHIHAFMDKFRCFDSLFRAKMMVKLSEKVLHPAVEVVKLPFDELPRQLLINQLEDQASFANWKVKDKAHSNWL